MQSMAQKKVGALIKEARTAAGLTQEKLAKAAGEKLTAADISKCEQGKADLTTAQLKAVAKACGVTQTSLVNAPKNLTDTAGKSNTAGKKATEKTAAAKTTAAKTTAAKAQTAKTAAAKKDTAKKTGVKETAAKTQTAKTAAAKENAAKKTAAKTQAAKTAAAKKPAAPAGANTSMKVTATEKKLIEAYRDAPADLKKAALKVLKGEYGETVNNLLGASSGAGATAADGVGEILGNLLGGILGGK